MKTALMWVGLVLAGGARAEQCPFDRQRLPVVNVEVGTMTATRLDLRPVGTGTLLVPLKRCPVCGLVVDWPLTREEYAEAVRAALVSPAGKAARAQRSTRFLKAVLLDALPEPAHVKARAWLEAAWETEGVDEPRRRQSLEAALLASRAAELAGPAKAGWFDGDRTDLLRTMKLLQIELLRQLGRFDEASAALDALDGAPEFARGAYPSLREQERALVVARDPLPRPLHRVSYPKEEDHPVHRMMVAIEGWEDFSKAFTARPAGGSMNGEAESLHLQVRSKEPRLVDAVWWWNVLDAAGRPGTTYAQLVAVLDAADRVARVQRWLDGWKAAEPGSSVALQLVGKRPWTSLGIERTRDSWTQVGLPGAPAWLFLLRRGSSACAELALAEDGSVGMVPSKYGGCSGDHWLDKVWLSFPTTVLVVRPDGTSEVRAVRREDPTEGSEAPDREPVPVKPDALQEPHRDPLLRRSR